MPDRESQIISTLNSFIGRDHSLSTYLHRLDSVELADYIFEKGFRFESHLANTTDHISVEDIVELTYFMNIRRAYGHIAIVIQIKNNLIHKVNEMLAGTSAHFSEALTTSTPVNSENEQCIYTLPLQFVKGYLDTKKSKVILNPNFDPGFKEFGLERNIEFLMGKQ